MQGNPSSLLVWQGNARIVGRVKDMIIRGGENVFPREASSPTARPCFPTEAELTSVSALTAHVGGRFDGSRWLPL